MPCAAGVNLGDSRALSQGEISPGAKDARCKSAGGPCSRPVAPDRVGLHPMPSIPRLKSSRLSARAPLALLLQLSPANGPQRDRSRNASYGRPPLGAALHGADP